MLRAPNGEWAHVSDKIGQRLKVVPRPAKVPSLTDHLDPALVDAVTDAWSRQARPEQLSPPEPWQTWLLMAGRGFGKTRAGAEWIHPARR
jgi:hypothetical protein